MAASESSESDAAAAEVVRAPPQEENGDAGVSRRDAAVVDAQDNLARGCIICRDVLAPAYAPQAADLAYWRCPGCEVQYRRPPTFARLQVSELPGAGVSPLPAITRPADTDEEIGAGGLSPRSPLPDDTTSTTLGYSIGAGGLRSKLGDTKLPAAASPPDSGSKEELPESKEPEASHLAQEIERKLARGAVECMICFEVVPRTAPIWSCSNCFAIFHLPCLCKWVRCPASAGDASQATDHCSWRCPGCQFVYATPARDLADTCFCGRRRDPPNDHFLTPHSCGETCSKPLAGAKGEDAGTSKCPHLCVLPCHPGPCPPCKSFAPDRLCPCGRKMIARRCADQSTPVNCGIPCQQVMTCRRHLCDKVCHTGPCGDCTVVIAARCFCSKKNKMLLCREWVVKGMLSEENGLFSCTEMCGRILACGNHACKRICHLGSCGECELLPGKVSACHCGKTKLEEKRASCLDAIPNCNKICDKKLPCDVHRCNVSCHDGECPPCMVRVEQKCCCGSFSQKCRCCYSVSMDEFHCGKNCPPSVVPVMRECIPCGKNRHCDQPPANGDASSSSGGKSSCGQGPVHLFVCYGAVETWPTTGPIVSEDSIPGLLSRCIKSRGHKINLSLFDRGNNLSFVEGDIIVFPQRRLYRSLDVTKIDTFVDTIVLSGGASHTEHKALMDSYFFICCQDHRDNLRECSVCGPVLLASLNHEIDIQGLEVHVQCYACTSISESSGEVMLFTADGKCIRCSHMFPGFLRLMLSDLFGDGTLDWSTGPESYDCWKLMLQILGTAAEVQTWSVAMRSRMDTSSLLVMREGEQQLRSFVKKLMRLCLMLRAAAVMCQAGNLTFQWLEVCRRELHLVVKGIYGSARSVRKTVIDKASLSVSSPTGIEGDLRIGVGHIDKLVKFGKDLSQFAVIELGGAKAFPKGKDLLKPIFGINIRNED